MKWSKGDSMQVLARFFNEGLSFDVMLQRVKEMVRQLPSDMAAVIKFNCLTGLRPAEAIESVRLIKEREALARYYRPERQTLEHYRFPEVFLRQTKKAYVSFITLDDLQPIANLGRKTPTWNDIRLACYFKGLKMDMRFCERSLRRTCRPAGSSRRLSTSYRVELAHQYLAAIT